MKFVGIYLWVTNGIDISDFLLQNISQNEFTENNTYTGGGHVPALPIWSTGVSVSIDRDIEEIPKSVAKNINGC